jgi:TraM recognition site of TraD and TraG
MIHHSENPRREMTNAEAGVVGAVLGFGAIGLVLYLVVARYHIRKEQLVEAGLYLFIVMAAFALPALRKFSRRRERRKRSPFVIPARQDERAIEAAWNQNAVLLGYDMDEKPWIWPDEVRVMQGIVLGMTGSGKTTLLKNIITQDIARFVGPPEDRHRIPIVIFDGKGDLEFFEQLLPHIHRAGRLHQLRLLNPSRADLSVLYNPFFTRDDNYMAQVNMIFGSFNLHDEFFAKHQLNYLGDIVRVLFYTGARYNFYDVIVMLLDEQILHEQIDKATHRLDRDATVSAQQRLNFEMSVKNLMQSLADRERVPKIQGLINECMTFLDDELSAVTGQYDDLLSIEDVIDQELILFVSLNANKNTEPVRSLGKMLLQNIQLTVGKRYEDQADRRRQNRPIFSVVLDEFAPFGYRNFAQILQTARGTNTAFLFSMQSLPQLMQVGRGFKEEVTSAPNTTMTLRTRDEETAEYFIKASAEQVVTRRSVQKERGLFGWGRYEETGRATESEDRETRSQDESIKNLPKGRMEILMSDDTRGTLHSLVQVRPPDEVVIPGFQPVIYPRLLHSRTESSGANLRFRDPELARKYRVPNRSMGGYRR